MKKIVIGFVGLPASGKSTALEAVKNLGKIITMGDVIRNETKKRGLEINSETLGQTAKDLRREFGPEIIAIKCRDLIESLEMNVIFVDGLRSMKEVNYFREKWKFPIISIECSDEIRYKRLLDRGRADDAVDIDGIKKRDERELQFGMGEVMENADYKISNDFDVEAMKEETKKTVLEIIEAN